MRPLVINVDSDGVVYDWHGWMLPYLAERLGRELTVDVFDTWDMAEALGLSKKDFYKIFDEAVFDGAFSEGGTIAGAAEALHTLVNAGHRVRIVTSKILKDTAKTLMAQADMLSFYASHDLLHKVEIVFAGSKWGKTAYPADLVIDDKPDLSWTQEEAVNVLFDQPWNQNLGNPMELPASLFEFPFNFYRAMGWRDVLELVEQMGGGILIDKSDRVPEVILGDVEAGPGE